jgi:hypothetical protein
MVLDRESERGTVNRRNIHGIMYGDGTIRDPAAIAALNGFFVNRGAYESPSPGALGRLTATGGGVEATPDSEAPHPPATSSSPASAVAPGVPNEETHAASVVGAANAWLASPTKSIVEANAVLDQVTSLLEAAGTAPMNLPPSGFARRAGAMLADRTPESHRIVAEALAAQVDALNAVMDGPVGVNTGLAGHTAQQYNTWEPGVCIFHLPKHGGPNKTQCADGDHLSLCGGG